MRPASSGRELPPMADNLKTLELLKESASASEVVSSDGADENKLIDGEKAESEGAAQVSEWLEVAVSKDAVDGSRADSCYTLGPFRDRVIMEQLKDSLSQQVSDVSVRKRTEAEKHRYWVHIPASGGRKGAKRTAAQLRDKQVKDFYIVLKGKARNSVSLGHFREQAHANRRLKRINALGFNAEVNVIYRDYDVYWLDYRVKANTDEAGFNADEYQSEGVSQISRKCEVQGALAGE